MIPRLRRHPMWPKNQGLWEMLSFVSHHPSMPIANKNVKKRSKSNPFAKTTERGQIRANLEMIRQDSRWRRDGKTLLTHSYGWRTAGEFGNVTNSPQSQESICLED
ncbi:hypothetical protein PABG_11397 [Paracoccidioides brasiliensis Pb03]|nr:hypothetical protein PABG_11397 [Paracoccidioides brasiliensis Pb03]